MFVGLLSIFPKESSNINKQIFCECGILEMVISVEDKLYEGDQRSLGIPDFSQSS